MFGVKMKNIWNHRLENIIPLLKNAINLDLVYTNSMKHLAKESASQVSK